MCTPEHPMPDFERSARGDALSRYVTGAGIQGLVTPEKDNLFLTGWYDQAYDWLKEDSPSAARVTRVPFNYYEQRWREDFAERLLREIQALMRKVRPSKVPALRVPYPLYDATGAVVKEAGVIVCWDKFETLVAVLAQTTQ